MAKKGITISVKRIKGANQVDPRDMCSVALPRAMSTIGESMQEYARNHVLKDTGHLESSITHQETVTESTYTSSVGTNVEYAPYIEYGTGPRGDPEVPHTHEMSWVYYDDDGEMHIGVSQPAHPFLRPAVYEQRALFERILEEEMAKVVR